jgi:hypothetical protein
MDERASREVSTEFLLQLAPVRRHHPIAVPEEVEFEIEASACGQVLSLHRHSSCCDGGPGSGLLPENRC